jgi:oxygen-independent coproporphyrinogen-3 oxidase
MKLMCDGALDLAEVGAQHGLDAAAYFAPELARVERELADLAEVDRGAGTVVATPLGHHLIRNLCVVFDRDGAAAQGSPTI